MPIYEYQCQQCDHKFDKLQKISADPLVDCPDCGQPKLIKLISAAGFRLKGSGWYETDFKTGKKKNLAETPSNKTDDKKKTKAKTDKKPTPKSQD
ncbi:MAG: zinc ribbon domain-containing protein [Xanthomonadales bacterium]|nr:zinc ribbon domain-containing protein [Xanthomonadales bacterium]